ncbi:MAG: hypothetical protein M3Y06_03980, partial [Actinomycetota bacterium]|nr:hypothetical protein [Actinomycetota bacterium]
PEAASTTASDEPRGTADQRDGAADEVWVADGFPEYHRQSCSTIVGLTAEPVPHDQAVEDGFRECSVCTPESSSATQAASGTPDSSAEVYVVDGFPEYHRQSCSTLAGLDSEPVAHDQAVGDGFTECRVCTPEAANAPDSATAPAAADSNASAESSAVSAASVAEVYVVDGFPEYHRQSCSTLAGLDSEPVAHDQAVGDGFTECRVCSPESAESASSEPAVASASQGERQVWVVDGHPDFHVETCAVLARFGNGEAIRFDQAVDDGFQPCTVCSPHVAPSAEPPADVSSESSATSEPSAISEPSAVAAVEDPAADTREVLVVDGYPDFHRASCSTLVGLDREPVPYDQAVEDGFQPCSVCRPGDGVAETGSTGSDPAVADEVPVHTPIVQSAPEPEAASAPEPTPEPEPEPTPVPSQTPAVAPPVGADASPGGAGGADHKQVWVVDGRPRYHAQDCLIIKGQPTSAVAETEAVGDGFLPCSLCQR